MRKIPFAASLCALAVSLAVFAQANPAPGPTVPASVSGNTAAAEWAALSRAVDNARDLNTAIDQLQAFINRFGNTPESRLAAAMLTRNKQLAENGAVRFQGKWMLPSQVHALKSDWARAAQPSVDAYSLEDWRMALNRAKQVIVKDKANLDAVAIAALASYRLGETGPAKMYFTTLSQADAGSPFAENNLGVMALEASRYGEALAHFVLAARINPDDPTVILNAAFSLAAFVDNKGSKTATDYVALRKLCDDSQVRIAAAMRARGMILCGAGWIPASQRADSIAQLQNKIKFLGGFIDRINRELLPLTPTLYPASALQSVLNRRAQFTDLLSTLNAECDASKDQIAFLNAAGPASPSIIEFDARDFGRQDSSAFGYAPARAGDSRTGFPDGVPASGAVSAVNVSQDASPPPVVRPKSPPSLTPDGSPGDPVLTPGAIPAHESARGSNPPLIMGGVHALGFSTKPNQRPPVEGSRAFKQVRAPSAPPTPAPVSPAAGGQPNSAVIPPAEAPGAVLYNTGGEGTASASLVGHSLTSDKPSINLPAPRRPHKKIQIALLVDCSGSMEDLLLEAKIQLWHFVSALSHTAPGQTPTDVEVALYQYGYSPLDQSDGYIRQLLPLTKDLDAVSAALFSLNCVGGEEYCGWVIKDAVTQLKWSQDPGVIKAIFIAGNESFLQGPVYNRPVIIEAAVKGITVNPVFCGPTHEGYESWKDAAEFAGVPFNVVGGPSKGQGPTPQDDELAKLSDRLSQTYIPYGPNGQNAARNQLTQDDNARKAGQETGKGSGIAADRAITKASQVYQNPEWDLVDAVNQGKVNLQNVKPSDLPADMRNLTPQERASRIDQIAAERAALQGQIQNLGAQRDQYIADHQNAVSINPSSPNGAAPANTLGDAIINNVNQQKQGAPAGK